MKIKKTMTSTLVKHREFCDEEIWEAARIGKYPPGMTAEHLIKVRKVDGNSKSSWTRPWSRPFRAAHPTAAYLLAPERQIWESNALVRAAVRGIYPRGTTTEHLKTQGEFVPIQYAAIFGHLLPGTTTRDLKIKVGIGKSPWGHALLTLQVQKPTVSNLEIAVRNILACPPLAGRLDLNEYPAQSEILKRVLASPKMIQKTREKLAKYPQVCAFMM